MAVTITRTAWTDDDGSGTVGTVINNAEKTTLYNQIDTALAALPVNGTSLAAHGVVIGEGTSAVAVVGPDATVGKPLLSAGAAADPAFGDLAVAHGGTGATTLTAHGVLIGEGTGAVAATSAGTTGQALLSRGASADPAFGPIKQTTVSTGTVNDFALTAGTSVLRCNNATLLTITGITAGFDGQVLIVESIGAGQVDLSHQAAGSTAANRLINFATSGATSLAAGVGTAVFEYDASTARWRLVAHEQGAWIVPTFAAGNYTANGLMTWTLAAGDVTTQAYYLRGRMLTVAFYLQTTTVGGTVNTTLQIGNGAWGSFTATRAMLALSLYNDNGAGNTQGRVETTASGTNIIILKNAATNFTLSTDLTNVFGELSFEVN